MTRRAGWATIDLKSHFVQGSGRTLCGQHLTDRVSKDAPQQPPAGKDTCARCLRLLASGNTTTVETAAALIGNQKRKR